MRRPRRQVFQPRRACANLAALRSSPAAQFPTSSRSAPVPSRDVLTPSRLTPSPPRLHQVHRGMHQVRRALFQARRACAKSVAACSGVAARLTKRSVRSSNAVARRTSWVACAFGLENFALSRAADFSCARGGKRYNSPPSHEQQRVRPSARHALPHSHRKDFSFPHSQGEQYE